MMPASIDTLPYEILSAILEEVMSISLRDLPKYTYGLSQAPEPLQDVQIQRVVRGLKAPDTVQWEASNSIRQVNRKWYEWAVEHAMEDVYIRRWRGSERWMDSRNLDKSQTRYAKTTVYRDPYYSLKKAAELFRQSPITAAYVRRLWFDGFYALETSAIMFKILRLCCNLKIVTLPWTALRYGSADDWSQLLGRGRERRHITSLELLAVDLKASQINDIANQVDRKALNSSSINFSSLKRLKIFGSTNFMPITDEDMVGISRTATNLEELHVTGTSSLTIKGIMAAAQASKSTLRTLEYSPLSADGFVHPDPANYDPKNHCCHMLLQCQQLRDLSISLPSICPDIFRHLPLHWRGVVQIRAGGLHGFYTDPKDSTEGFQQFWNTIKEAQALMESRLKDNIQLDIELFINQWIFEPRFSRVHGNIEIGELLSDGLWPISKTSSCKGPRGHTSTYGKEDRPYSCISEESFRKGLRHSYISF